MLKCIKNESKVKVHYKPKEELFFLLKDDSTALIHHFSGGKLSEIRKYTISPKYDTVYVKRCISVKGGSEVKVEKMLYQKVY